MLAGSYCAPVTRALPFFVLKLTLKTKTQLGCKATVFFRKTFENFFFDAFSVRATHAEYDFLIKNARFLSVLRLRKVAVRIYVVVFTYRVIRVPYEAPRWPYHRLVDA